MLWRCHCETHFFNTTLDWKPFEHLSLRQEVFGLILTQTRRITPAENGPQLNISIAKPPSGASQEMKEMIIRLYTEAGGKLMKLLETDVADGTITMADES